MEIAQNLAEAPENMLNTSQIDSDASLFSGGGEKSGFQVITESF